MQGPINVGEVMSVHAKFKRAHHALLDRELVRAGKFGVSYVHLHPTFKRRTGNLQNQTSYRIVRLKSGAVVRLENRAKYAGYVEYGTKPHPITASAGKTLRFVIRGVVFFRKRVKHKGSRPFKFLYRATNAMGRVFETSMRAGMAAIAQKF